MGGIEVASRGEIMVGQADSPEKYMELLGSQVNVVMDRPLGSLHPEYGFVYERNYGYVPGTQAGDGEPIDAYVLGIDTPIASFRGRCIAVILRKDDDEHKLVISAVPLSKAEIASQTHFVERFYDSEIVAASED